MTTDLQLSDRLAGEILNDLGQLPNHAGGSMLGAKRLQRRIDAASRKTAGDPDQQAVVLATAVRAVLSIYADLWDSESEIAEVVADTLHSLAALLPQAQTQESQARQRRHAILGVWLETALWDAFSGGYGLDEAAEELLLTSATAEEGQELAEIVRLEVAKHGGPSKYRGRQHAGRLALQLLAAEPVETQPIRAKRLQLLAEAGLYVELAKYHLGQGDLASALAAIDASQGHDLVELTQAFAAAGQLTAAQLAVARHPALADPEVKVPLERLVALGVVVSDEVWTLRQALSGLRNSPTLHGWAIVRETANALGRWPQVLDFVRLRPERAKDVPLAVRWHAARGEAEAAVAMLGQLSGSTWNTAAMAVADDLGATHPETAGVVYRQVLAAAVARGTKAGRELAAVVREKLGRVGMT